MKQDTEGLMLYGFFCVSLSLSLSLSLSRFYSFYNLFLSGRLLERDISFFVYRLSHPFLSER